MNVHERVSEYTICALAEDHPEHYLFEITVQYRAPGQWAVHRMKQVLGADGDWEWEPSPSNREDDWLATHRFPLDEALRLAREAAPHVSVNGWTPATVLARGGAA